MTGGSTRPLASHLSVAERQEIGRAARKTTPRSLHADWSPAPGRADPVEVLAAQNATRVPWLVPLRHARMQVSPFTFYRGTAAIMAGDLAPTPVSGLDVQLGGDAHLSNFGGYASPERRLVFDANDFDETLRGPWEWDLARLAVSFTIAGEHLGFPAAVCRSLTALVVQSYRESMAHFATMGFTELWYDHVSVDAVRAVVPPGDAMTRRIDRFERRALRRTSHDALQKLTVEIDGAYRIRSAPPVLLPLRDLPAEYDVPAFEAAARTAFDSYRDTVSDDRRWLLERHRIVDVGVKVVGVGSVGTRCLVVLLEGRDHGDPLFLQVKEAGPSVLEEHLAPSPYDNHGRRVVEGQRMIQAHSDIFLGWTSVHAGFHFYVRQLRDWKGSVDIERATPERLQFYARLCGHTLAGGHARSGDAVAISAYAGTGAALDRAMTAFAEQYSAQNRRDYDEFVTAIRDGRMPVADAV